MIHLPYCFVLLDSSQDIFKKKIISDHTWFEQSIYGWSLFNQIAQKPTRKSSDSKLLFYVTRWKNVVWKRAKSLFYLVLDHPPNPLQPSLFFIKLNQPKSQLLLDAWKFQFFTHSSINPQYRTLSLSFADMNQNHSNKSRVMRLDWIIHFLEETINNTRRVSGSSCGHFFKTWSLTCLHYENFANPSQRAEF